MRIGVALDERKVLNDSGTAQSTNCPLRDRDLRLALHFRELRPAVPGETEEEPSSMTDSCNVHEPLKRKRQAFISGNEPTQRHRGFSSAGVGSSFGR